jgi:hypothetical protein
MLITRTQKQGSTSEQNSKVSDKLDKNSKSANLLFAELQIDFVAPALRKILSGYVFFRKT